jgi:hypothetical protein
MINTYNLFAVKVTQAKAPLNLNTHRKIISFVEKEYKEEDNVSCRNGFQFHGDFDGKKEIDSFLNMFLKNTFSIEINHAWLNILGNNSYNIPHFHYGNDVTYAGVYYLSNDNNNIVFTKNEEIFEIRPKIYDLLIFPFNLVHYVLPENRPSKRICYAFNLNKIK